MDLQQKLAKTLRELRKLKSDETGSTITQQEMADGAGIDVRYYGEIERGTRKPGKRSRKCIDLGDDVSCTPTLTIIAKFAETLEMSLSEFCRHIEEQRD